MKDLSEGSMKEQKKKEGRMVEWRKRGLTGEEGKGKSRETM